MTRKSVCFNELQTLPTGTTPATALTSTVSVATTVAAAVAAAAVAASVAAEAAASFQLRLAPRTTTTTSSSGSVLDDNSKHNVLRDRARRYERLR